MKINSPATDFRYSRTVDVAYSLPLLHGCVQRRDTFHSTEKWLLNMAQGWHNSVPSHRVTDDLRLVSPKYSCIWEPLSCPESSFPTHTKASGHLSGLYS